MNRLARMFQRGVRLAEEFRPGTRWRHYKGATYVIIGVANIANYNPKYRPVVVFQSEVNHNLWTKTPKRFRETMTAL